MIKIDQWDKMCGSGNATHIEGYSRISSYHPSYKMWFNQAQCFYVPVLEKRK